MDRAWNVLYDFNLNSTTFRTSFMTTNPTCPSEEKDVLISKMWPRPVVPSSRQLWSHVQISCPQSITPKNHEPLVRTVVAVGEPLSFAQNKSPSAEELDAAHKMFCKALVDLFDEYKLSLGYEDRSLEI